MKTLIVTACGASKHNKPMEAWKLYKSTRIKSIYRRKGDCDMAILSAKYGLINAEAVIEPYNQKMDGQRAKELENQVIEKIQGYNQVIFYRGGSSEPYRDCIENVCRKIDVPLLSFGYANQGDIGSLTEYISLCN